MKKIIEETEEGLERLLGENVWLWCVNYTYAGRLVGVSDREAKLADAHIVYETGELCGEGFKNSQKLPGDHFVCLSAVESYGKSGR